VGGALAAKSTSSIGTGPSPTGIAVSPDGKSVYVANSGDGTVSQYDVGSGGVLSAKGSAVGLVGGSKPGQPTLASSGARLYVPDAAAGHNVVYEFALASGGAIVPNSARFIGAGPAPAAITVLPDQGPVAAFNAAPGPARSPSTFDGGPSTDSDGSVTHFDWD